MGPDCCRATLLDPTTSLVIKHVRSQAFAFGFEEKK